MGHKRSEWKHKTGGHQQMGGIKFMGIDDSIFS